MRFGDDEFPAEVQEFLERDDANAKHEESKNRTADQGWNQTRRDNDD